MTPAVHASRRLVAWLVFVLAVATLGYSALAADTETPGDIAYRYSAAALAVVQFGVFLGIAYLIARGLSLRDAFGLKRPASWRRSLGVVVVALVATYIAASVYLLVLSLVSERNPSQEQGLLPDEWDSSRAGAFLVFAVTVVSIGPLTEELIFRGLGFSLLDRYGKWVQIIATGVLFGLWHGLLIALPVLAAFGVILGWVRATTGSVLPCILLHAVFNGIALATVPLSG